ncbi:hypothetical protein SEA_ZOOMAN_223 [Microbacterium phage Zooman]|nr:hypothetical protein SEA_ZOOMAN_223 [Microbacterium phage Zooman]
MTLLLTRKDDVPQWVTPKPSDPEKWSSVFTSPSGFMVARSERNSGTTEGGKNWSRFQETDVEFFSKKSGAMKVYRKSRIVPRDHRGHRNGRSKMGTVRDVTSIFLSRMKNHRNPEALQLYDLGAQSMGYDSILDMTGKEFPLYQGFDMHVPGIASLMRHENLVSMSRHVLGKNFQKSIPRLLGTPEGAYASLTRSGFLELAMVFQGIVPTDWISEILEAQDKRRGYGLDIHTRDEMRKMRRFLRTGTQTQLRRLTRNPTDRFMSLLRDSYRRMETLENTEFRTLEQLHDTVAPRVQAARRVIEADREITLTKKAEEFVGEGENFTVIAPGKTGELYEWSKIMGNCISGYGSYAVDGHSQLFAVMQEDKMVGNIELGPDGSIKQLLGKYNRSLDEDLNAALKARVKAVWPKADINPRWE